jgi:4-hydroxy-tetrahydrodipicolinate synthase
MHIFIQHLYLVRSNNHEEALKKWKLLYGMIPLLFAEPNPAPLKYCLNKLGLIESDEVRLPLIGITQELKIKLDKML